ncbi:hypothetical protein EDB85DRAFT_997253 [Lactarius pseudohatsudake]|nr:hypothetical protein EDB85DRAFT_997253 [Lactarius pseudohatsudake]
MASLQNERVFYCISFYFCCRRSAKHNRRDAPFLAPRSCRDVGHAMCWELGKPLATMGRGEEGAGGVGYAILQQRFTVQFVDLPPQKAYGLMKASASECHVSRPLILGLRPEDLREVVAGVAALGPWGLLYDAKGLPAVLDSCVETDPLHDSHGSHAVGTVLYLLVSSPAHPRYGHSHGARKLTEEYVRTPGVFCAGAFGTQGAT